MIDKVKIVFGMELDGESWSSETSVNRYVCGPLGLLKYIENQVGRIGKEIGEAERVAAYQAKIVAAQKVVAELWCARSFEADAWSTAKQMLQWRDQIKELRRDLDLPKGVSRRFDDIAAIEAAGDPLPEGVIDRAVALAKEGRRIKGDVHLVCRHDDLPKLWYDLIMAYFGGTTEYRPARPLPKITIVRAHDEVALARDFARWVAADKDANGGVALIVDGDSSLLDNELRALGQPAIGNAASSASRQALQILPEKLMAFWVGKKLDVKIPADAVKQAIDEADKELEGRIGRDKTMSEIARSHVSTMRKLTTGVAEIKRSQLLRMLETVTGDGCARPGVWNEVGCPRVAKTPEALATLPGEDVKRPQYTLWWDFTDRKSAPMMRFTAAEAEVVGVWNIKHDVEALRKRELSGWQLAVEGTQKEIVFFAPYSKKGESAAVHPYYDYLSREVKKANGADSMDNHVFQSTDLVDENGVWHLADRKIEDLRAVHSLVRKFDDAVELPKIEKVPETVSQSQMETLISCPFAWYHKNYLGLAESPASKVESEALHKGNHAHKLVENLVNLGVVDDAGVDKYFDELFNDGLKDELPELLEPESVVRYDEYKKLLRDSVKFLWQKIADDGLTIIASEKEFFKTDFHGSILHGFVDMYLKDKDGNDVIFDFKWSRSQKRYEEMINEGMSIQFAVYHHLLKGKAKCYYYLFPLMKFIEDTQDNESVFKKVEEAYTLRLAEVKKGTVKKAILTGLENPSKSAARAAEVAAAKLPIDIPAKCSFCELKELCGRERESKEKRK